MEIESLKQKFLEDTSSLYKLIDISDVEDIDILVDYITDNGEGRVSLNADVCKRLLLCKSTQAYNSQDRTLVIDEIRRFGGNSIANVFRNFRNSLSFDNPLDSILPDANSAVTYEEIVCDVAKHMRVQFNKSSSVSYIEQGILIKLLRDSYDKMSADERANLLKDLGIADISVLMPGATAILIGVAKWGGFKTYQIALIVANAVAKAILGKGLSFTGNQVLTKVISLAIGPIGWVITGLWTAADFASPAYRVTVPCVVQIAFMRQKALVRLSSKTCGKCHADNTLDAKFCTECGAAL